MDKKDAYRIVLDDMKKVDIFMGKYDAIFGSRAFMHGVCMVMENIAYNVSDEVGDAFSDEFTTNIVNSIERYEKLEAKILEELKKESGVKS